MPGGNGTGPLGQGPMTGRAAGFCAGYQVPGYANPVGGRGFFGRGRGFGGRGGGFGRGRGYSWAGAGFGFPVPVQSPITGEQEMQELKQQAEFLQSSLGQINERINQLQTEGGK